nr:MAG TPA: hypothetical protein [Crassvirales sp.]
MSNLPLRVRLNPTPFRIVVELFFSDLAADYLL